MSTFTAPAADTTCRPHACPPECWPCCPSLARTLRLFFWRLVRWR